MTNNKHGNPSYWRLFPNRGRLFIEKYKIILATIILCLFWTMGLINVKLMLVSESQNQQNFLWLEESEDEFENLKKIVESPTNEVIVSYFKRHHLTPPSEQAYNFAEYEKTDPSEHSQVIQRLFRNRAKKTPGFFIEAGANDGYFLSNTLTLEKDMGWSGLLIEAGLEHVAKLRTRHRKAWIADVCLSPTNGVDEIEFLCPISVNKAQHIGQKKLRQFDNLETESGEFGVIGLVKCFPLQTMMAALNRSHVDFFSLDVQGVEFKILKTLPWHKKDFKIDAILVSHDLVPEGQVAMRHFMESCGYQLYLEMKQDFLFVHKNANSYSPEMISGDENEFIPFPPATVLYD